MLADGSVDWPPPPAHRRPPATPCPGAVTFELAGANGDGTEFKSRNSTANRPELIIDTDTPAG
jgi:hypothetical protein